MEQVELETINGSDKTDLIDEAKTEEVMFFWIIIFHLPAICFTIIT